MSTKDLSTLTPEELMKIAQNPIKDDKTKDLDPVARFIISDNIKKGDIPIPAAVIFNRFLKWSAAYNVQPISSIKFFSKLKSHFQKVHLMNGSHYLMSSEGFDLSPQNIEQSTRQVKRNSNGKKKKKEVPE